MKYKEFRKLTEVQCDNCGIIHSKPTSEYLRNLKLNRKMFCSRNCSVIYGNSIRDRSKGNYYNLSKHSNNRKDEFSPFKQLLRSSKIRNKELSITLQDLKEIWEKQNGICPYTKFQLQLNQAENRMLKASLDRIDNSKGYTKDNVEFVCMAINFMKNTFTREQVKQFLSNFKNSDFSEDRTISSPK